MQMIYRSYRNIDYINKNMRLKIWRNKPHKIYINIIEISRTAFRNIFNTEYTVNQTYK